MIYSSHRLRARERQAGKKLFLSILILVGSVIFAVYLGLPLMAKLAVGLSFFRGEEKKSTETSSLPLFAPVIEQLPSATNSASIPIVVISEKGKTIVLSINGEKIREETADEEGKVKFRGVNLTPGENNISAVAKNDDRESEAATAKVNYIKDPPKLEISEPEEGKTIYGDPNIVIKGATDKDTRITVNDRFVIVDKEGLFSYQTVLKEGENVFKIKAESEAGNVTDKEFKINYSL